jgi:hypothetical protein
VAERTRRSRAGGGTSRRSARSQESAEGRLNRDYGDEEYREPGEGYDGEEPTKGLYTCELVRISDHTSQDGNESVKWLFRLADGSENKHGDDVSGWMDSQYTTENTAWKEQQMLVALGVIKPGGKVNLPYDGIVKKAKPCTVRVGTERVIDDDGEGHWRGRMQAFLPLRDATAAKRGPSKRSRDDEDAEDVFEGDEDEDAEDEEEPPPARGRRSTSRSRRRAEPEDEPEDEDEEGDEEDEEGEEEDYDPDALAAELEDLSLAALKKRAKDEFGVTIKRGMKADDIIDAILDTLEEGDEAEEDAEDEAEEEESPPPPKRASRTRSAKPNSRPTTTRRKRGSSDDPPF